MGNGNCLNEIEVLNSFFRRLVLTIDIISVVSDFFYIKVELDRIVNSCIRWTIYKASRKIPLIIVSALLQFNH